MNKEKLTELYKEYKLEKEDVFKHQHYLIITRSGIDKIQAVAKIQVNYRKAQYVKSCFKVNRFLRTWMFW